MAEADNEFLSLIADLVFFSSVFGVLDFGLSLLAGDKALLLDGLGVSLFFWLFEEDEVDCLSTDGFDAGAVFVFDSCVTPTY